MEYIAEYLSWSLKERRARKQWLVMIVRIALLQLPPLLDINIRGDIEVLTSEGNAYKFE